MNSRIQKILLTLLLIVTTSSIFTYAQHDDRKNNNLALDPHEKFKNLVLESEKYLLFDTFKYRNVIDSALLYNNAQIEEIRFKNLTFLGRYYWQKSAMDSALNIFNQLKENIAPIQDKKLIATYYSNFGLLYYSLGDYQESINSHWTSLNISKKLNDTIGIAKGYNNLGIVYLMIDDTDKALDYHTLSLKLCEEKNIMPGIANCLGNLGIVYRKRNELDKAIEVYLRSLSINKQTGDRLNEALNYNNLGAVYEYKNEFNKALEFYEKSLPIRKELKDNSGVALALHNIGAIHSMTGNYNKAEKYFLEALTIATETYNKVVLKETNKRLSELYEIKGQNKKALAYLKLYEQWKDSLINEKNYETIKNLEFKYETEKKENEILKLNHENSLSQSAITRKNSLIKMMITAIVLIIVIFILIVALFMQRAKTKEKIFAKEKALDKLKDGFFTSITHEFKTPLTLILDPAESLINNESHHEKIELLKLIRNNGQKLLNLVNELLTLSKIEAGKQTFHLSSVNLQEFLKSVLAVYHSISKSKNIRFKISLPEKNYEIQIDKPKIEKVLNNLLENAFKFTPAEGTIYFAANVDNNILQFRIKDTGLGIDIDDQKKIFTKYFSGRISPYGDYQNFGIGLALVKEFVEMHNGHITLLSKPNHGTEFTVEIPIQSNVYAIREIQHSIDTNYEAINYEITEESAISPDKPLILLVEDNSELLQHLKKSLEKLYKIRTSRNGEDGLMQSIKYIPDLIISDVVMPKMDGIELCKKIKDNEVTNHIPIILLTAKSEVEDRMKGFATGADDYIPKPFQIEELKIRIKNLINQRLTLREKYSKTLSYKVNDGVNLSSRDDSFLIKINSIIEKNILENDFDVNELALALGISRMQLHRKLKATTGTSTSEYIRNYRLQKAAELLTTKHVTIAEIAYEVGFNKPAYFSESFKKLFNKTPLEYQQSSKKVTS